MRNCNLTKKKVFSIPMVCNTYFLKYQDLYKLLAGLGCSKLVYPYIWFISFSVVFFLFKFIYSFSLKLWMLFHFFVTINSTETLKIPWVKSSILKTMGDSTNTIIINNNLKYFPPSLLTMELQLIDIFIASKWETLIC